MLDASKFAFSSALEASYSTALAELEQLTRDDFIPNPCYGGYEGAWMIFPLFFGTFDSGFDPHFPGNQAKCPEVTRLLQAIPGVISGGFSWLDPQSKINSHTDLQAMDIVRAHIGLRIPEGSMFCSGETRCIWEVGRCMVFDGTVEHAASNRSDEPRVILFADSRLEGAELSYLESTRR